MLTQDIFLSVQISVSPQRPGGCASEAEFAIMKRIFNQPHVVGLKMATLDDLQT